MERALGDPRPPSPMHGPNLWPSEDALPGGRLGGEGGQALRMLAGQLG